MMKREALRSSLLLTSGIMPLMITLTGCDTATEYTIPNTICGRKIDPSLLKPLLPAGQKFKARQESIDEKKSECVIYIDESTALRINEIRDQNKFDVWEYARRYNNPVKSDIGEVALNSDDWLISMNPCPRRGKYHILDVIIVTGRVTEAKPKELEEFARTYLPEGMKKMGCTA
ncbi:hypothetical protein JL475_30790 [Streptomyces sp. M2CJ-2]|uniref:hypothetical protein n=1 Tax=Streptomyces sp. M2CJ-2 TaxID=2803948 RepID=UPI00192901DB|nr:hypothetical protein [Streptomyces sp. M2CJ-2]MBL3670286.1 hypothetical protein [Streptomyces sp. M2CJ-2]